MIRYINGQPTGIYYSQHSDGAAYSWDDPDLSKYNDRVSLSSSYYLQYVLMRCVEALRL